MQWTETKFPIHEQRGKLLTALQKGSFHVILPPTMVYVSGTGRVQGALSRDKGETPLFKMGYSPLHFLKGQS